MEVHTGAGAPVFWGAGGWAHALRGVTVWRRPHQRTFQLQIENQMY